MKDRPIGSMSAVGALSQDLTFVSDSQDVAAIREDVGESAYGYDSFFVGIENGDYTEIWGMCGIIPRLSKLVSKLR